MPIRKAGTRPPSSTRSPITAATPQPFLHYQAAQSRDSLATTTHSSHRTSYRTSSKSGSIQSRDYNPFSDPKRPPLPHQRTFSKFSLSPDPSSWGYDVSPKSYDPDDWLHKDEKDLNSRGSFCNSRGIPTIGCITLLALILVGLFLGYPIQDAIRHKIMSHNGGYNLGGINSTGQISESVFSLVDDDTPQEVRTKASPVDGRTMRLVFSDEFNRDGRTFYPGDDPYWEAVDLHYWGTGDLEWYDPSMVYTKDGSLVLEVAEANPIDNHNMSYIGGMVTSWNKFCFTGGYIEASVQLPGSPTVNGFWPAVWTMGNLGRAGYGASTEGLWPYSYEACDIGTVPNQTENGFPPVQELQMGDQYSDYALSYLPGQRLSACTCPGEPHPGPVHRDGTFMARSSPEIDMIEAQIDSGLGGRGSASQSAQFAPFNGYYRWDNATYATYYMQPDEQHLNTYGGGVYQQAGSTVSLANQECYQLPHSGGQGCYSIYGFQYKPGYAEDGAYITWVNDDKLSWRLEAAGFGPDATTGISARPVSKEPMYILANLGISQGFSGAIDFDLLTLPAYMKVDWIRVYQYEDDMNVGCDPPNYPTSNYINAYPEAYTNPNITTWSLPRNKGGLGEPWPKNSRVTPCD